MIKVIFKTLKNYTAFALFFKQEIAIAEHNSFLKLKISTSTALS